MFPNIHNSPIRITSSQKYTPIVDVSIQRNVIQLKKKKAKGRASKGKGLTTSAWLPQFDPQNPHKGGQRELTPQNWPLTSISTPRHVHMHPHAYTLIHTVKRKSIIDKTVCVVYVYLCVYLCIRIWRPVVNIRCFFSLLLSILFFETQSLTKVTVLATLMAQHVPGISLSSEPPSLRL